MSVWIPHTTRHPIALVDHGHRPETKGLVIHINDGTFDGTISWFENPNRELDGAHLEIGNDKVWQLADLDRLCWHAGAANSFTFGFEHVGIGGRSRDTWLANGHELAYSANRAAWALQHYRLGPARYGHNVWPHSWGGADWGGHTNCPGSGFPWDVWIRMALDAHHSRWGWK